MKHHRRRGPRETLKDYVFSNTKANRDRKRDTPKPLPLKRAHVFSLEHANAPQPTSALLTKLPAELRLIIWQYCIRSQHLHIVRCPGRLASRTCCNKLAPDAGWLSHAYCWGRTPQGCVQIEHDNRRQTAPLQPFPLNDSSNSGTSLALLTTCRIVYREVVELLYTENFFDVNHIDTVIYLRNTILPARFDTIRHLRLVWCLQGETYKWQRPDEIVFYDKPFPPHDMATWRAACGTLADMQGLQSLCVIVRCALTPMWLTAKAWGPLLDPLAQVREECAMEVILQKSLAPELTEELDALYRFKMTEIPWPTFSWD